MNYVRMFYNAMSIFVRKHYSGSRAGVFNLLIHLAIWIRALLSAASHFIRRIGLPLMDAGLILLSFWLMKNIWSQYVRTDIEYERRLLWVAFPVYTILYLITAYYAGLYDRWYKRTELMRSTFIATIILLAGYALLPERFRFSRGILLFGSVLAFVLISLLRWLLIRTNVLNSSRHREENASTLLVASPQEYQQTVQLIKEAGMHERILGRIAVGENDETAVGYWKKLKELSKAIPFREVIFCEGSLSFNDIIKYVPQLPSNLRIKFQRPLRLIDPNRQNYIAATCSVTKREKATCQPMICIGFGDCESPHRLLNGICKCNRKGWKARGCWGRLHPCVN